MPADCEIRRATVFGAPKSGVEGDGQEESRDCAEGREVALRLRTPGQQNQQQQHLLQDFVGLLRRIHLSTVVARLRQQIGI